ncbi:MAG: SH3 domain-containing C40 family peptidase [Rikenellaceae bacterium]
MKKVLFVTMAALLVFSCYIGPKSEEIKEQFDMISKKIKSDYAPDRRVKTYEPIIEISADAKTIVLRGSTTEIDAKEALLKALKAKNIDVLDSMVVLPDPSLGEKTYGITSESVINFRYGPDYSSESATQTTLGVPLKILEKRGGWTRAITPEGYIAWATSGSIQAMNEQEYKDWSAAQKLIITTYYTLFRDGASENAGVVMDGVMGNIVRTDGVVGNYYKVILPNGKNAYLLKAHAEDFGKWLDNRNPTPENIIATAKKFLGFPYMWGGTSIKAMDCSGFTKTTYFLNGIILERDASQQGLAGDNVSIENGIDSLKMGDLIFFGSKGTEGKKERISHVGIYIGDGEFIHSATSVRINSLIPDAANYYEGSTRLVRAQRILTKVDLDKDITSIKKHPWYFPE